MTISPLPLDLDVRTVARDGELVLALRGEADLSNHHRLEASLRNLELADVATVYLDMSDLDFCGVPEFSRIVAFAANLRAQERELVVFGARPIIKKMARIVGAANELRFA